jgi:GT2 family glycosyltransferase
MPEQPFVSIVVPTFRNPGPLSETLASLRALEYPPARYEIVVVDDGSNDGTAGAVEALKGGKPPAVRYHEQPRAGAAAARNQGARLASGEILIFVDDDMLVPPGLIARHLEALRRHAPAAISGFREFAPELAAQLGSTPFGRFRLAVEPRQEWGERYERDIEESGGNCRPHPGGLTANDLAVRRDDFFRIGGFDEEFPYAGYEDQDFAVRAGLAGLACLVDYDLVAWHNDRRLTLREFGERQRRGAMTSVLLASKYPERYRDRTLFRENEPIRGADRPLVAAKKLVKWLLSKPLGTAGLFALVAVLERFAPNGRALQRLYTVVTGVYIFTGIRQGLARWPT